MNIVIGILFIGVVSFIMFAVEAAYAIPSYAIWGIGILTGMILDTIYARY